MKIDMNKIAEDAMYETIKEICGNVIEHHPGWGIESEVKGEIKKITREILNEPEMKEAIKNKIVYWIKSQ